MPRQARIDAPGALHPIIIRGIEGKGIFRDDQDREDFLERLSDLLQENMAPCYAWALMTNHVHLLLRAGTVGISSIMRRLLTVYAWHIRFIGFIGFAGGVIWYRSLRNPSLNHTGLF